MESIEKIMLYTADFSDKQTFYNSDDQVQYNAVCHLLLAIGEETIKLEDRLKEEMAFIAWDQIGSCETELPMIIGESTRK